MSARIVATLRLLSVSVTALASAETPLDAKRALSIQPGDYTVVSADSDFPRENLCVKGDIDTVDWYGTPAAPVLSIGAAKNYHDFNQGLKTDSKPYYADHCVYRHSTQVVKGRLIDDTFANCAKGNTTTHTELQVKGTTLVYSSETKISRDGKIVVVPSNCTLQLIKKP